MEWPIRIKHGWRTIGGDWLKAGEIGLIRPGQPRLGVGKDLGAVFLQRHQVLQGVHPRVETGRNETREDTGNVGTVSVASERRVLALSDEQF